MEYILLFTILHVFIGILIITIKNIDKETDSLPVSGVIKVVRFVVGAALGPLSGIVFSLIAERIFNDEQIYYCPRCGRQKITDTGPCSLCDKVEDKYPVLKIGSWQCDNCGTKVRGSNKCPGCNQNRVIELEPEQNSSSNPLSQDLENKSEFSCYSDEALHILYKSDLDLESKERYRLELIKRGYSWFKYHK